MQNVTPALILFFIIGLASSQPASAGSIQCYGEITAWPGDTIPVNGRIVLTGTWFASSLIDRVATLNPRLAAGDHVVPLHVAEQYHSLNKAVSQVVLIPNGDLIPNMRYHLMTDSSHLFYKYCLVHPHSASQVHTYDVSSLVWTTTDEMDVDPPRWEAADSIPVVTLEWWKKPAEFLQNGFYLQPSLSDANPIRILVEVVPQDRSEPTQRALIFPSLFPDRSDYYALALGPGNSKAGASLGIVLQRKTPYEARFVAIDVSGNRTIGPNDCVFNVEWTETGLHASCKECVGRSSDERPNESVKVEVR